MLNILNNNEADQRRSNGLLLETNTKQELEDLLKRLKKKASETLNGESEAKIVETQNKVLPLEVLWLHHKEIIQV